MHFVIWSGAKSRIQLPRSMNGVRHLIDASGGWRPALAKLPVEPLSAYREGITTLEIDCHGLPGQLRLPDASASGLVDHTNVDEFAAMLRPSLSATARIELLACLVAGIDVRRGPDDGSAPAQYSESVLSEYWGAYEREPSMPNTERFSKTAVLPAIGQQAVRMRHAAIEKKRHRWPAAGNGLEFCLRLAARARAIVRASDTVQHEEGDPAVDTFGNWEGHVWDFWPDGTVKYLGLNVQRTQPAVTWSPGRLRENGGGGRPMTDTVAADPLRPQRLSRANLPA